MRLAAVMSVVLGAAACRPAPPHCGPSQSFTPAHISFGSVGQPLTVELAVDAVCDDGITVSADTTVADPDNTAIALDGGAVVLSADATGARVSVTFTPQQPGPYHLVAQFQPSLGAAQVDVLVATDHTHEQPAFTVADDALGGCTHLEITPQSHLLCLQPLQALFESDGGRLQAFDSVLAGYLDGTLWLTDSMSLTRWVEGAQSDGGPGFVRSPDVGFAVGLDNLMLVPTASGVVLYDGQTTVQRINANDAGLFLTGTVQVGAIGTVAWANDNEALIISSFSTCGLSFDAGADGCGPAPFAPPFAVDRTGVWSLVPTTDGFTSTTVPTLNVVTRFQTATLPAPQDAQAEAMTAPFIWETVPAVVTGGHRFLVSSSTSMFRLDEYPPLLSFRGATATAVTLLDDPQHLLLIYAR